MQQTKLYNNNLFYPKIQKLHNRRRYQLYETKLEESEIEYNNTFTTSCHVGKISDTIVINSIQCN